MQISQSQLIFTTPQRGLINITADIALLVSQAQISTGLCHLFLLHTSASLILCENADPLVLSDLETFMQRFIPDTEGLYQHIAEGLDDMPAHIRTILTQNSLTIPIHKTELNLGTWQGIFLWEHRLDSHQRKLTVTLQGN